jgi:lambda family phage portal protein
MNLFSRIFSGSQSASLSPKASDPMAQSLKPKASSARNYAFGQTNRLNTDFFSGSLTADQAIFGSLQMARNRARTLERDNNLVRKFLVMLKTNVIGSKGFRLQSQAANLVGRKLVPDPNDQAIIEAHFEEFSRAENYSASRRLDRRLMSQIELVRIIVDGECIRRKIRGAKNPYGIAYQLIDAERLDHTLNRPAAPGQNEIRMGVEIDSFESPVAYYFLDAAPPIWSGLATVPNKHTRIPAAEIDHLFIPERPHQTRGFTYLAPSGLRTKMLESLEHAVTVNYRIAAAKMGFFKKTENYQPGENEDQIETPQEVAPGEFWELPEGMEFQNFDPSPPTGDFAVFKASIIREIASGFGISYPELANDFGGVSYSAGQIGVHSDTAFYADLQQYLIDYSAIPAFRDFLLFGLTTRAIPLPLTKLEKYQAAKFQPPRRKHIDPLKTHNAQSRALGDMSRGPFDVSAENGVDFEDVVEEFVRARQLLEAQNFPMPASWGGSLPVQIIPPAADEAEA